MRHGKRIAILSGLLILSGAAAVASAATVPFPVSDHFETGETLGAAPVNWSLSSGTTDIYVVDTKNDAQPSPDPDGTQALLVNTTVSHGANIGFVAQDKGKIQAKFLLRINSEPTGEDYRFSLSGTGVATYLRIRPHNAGTAKGFTYYSNGKHNALLDGVVVGDWYQVTMIADIDTQKWDLTVSNVTDPSPAQTVQVTGTPFSFPSTNIKIFSIANIGTSLNATIDALEIQSVPEPGSIGLLGLGGLLILRRRRK